MANNKPNWSSLNNQEKHDALQKVIERGGWDKPFHEKCLDKDPNVVRTTVEEEAGVTFDSGVDVACFKDPPSAEKKVLILLPPLVAQEQPPQTQLNTAGFWMCTYATYNPTRVTLKASRVNPA
jgi:hypothetical protein